MAVNVNYFKLFVEFISNKAQSGGTISPSQFNLVANQAQMLVFEKDYQIFLQTESISEYLSLFLKNQTTSVPATGLLPYPSDLEHVASIRSYYVRPSGKSSEITVEWVKNSSWGDVVSSQLMEPTKRFPMYSDFSTEIRFAPKNIGSVMVDYFKTPVAPVWGYVSTSGRSVYDAGTSTNFEFDLFAMNNVAAVYLSLIGINLKDGELQSWSDAFTKQTNSTL